MTATIIDALVVSLDLDAKPFAKGQKDAGESLTKMRKSAQQESKAMGEAFGQVGRELLGLFAIFTAGKGLEEFLKDVVATDAAVGRLAVTLDTTTQELSTLRGLATMTGGTVDGITGSVMGLSAAFQMAQLTGQSSVIPFLRALQQLNPALDFNDVGHGKILKFYMDLSKAVHGMDPARAKAYLNGMGIADPGSVNAIIAGQKALQALIAEQQRLGVITDADKDAGIKLQHSLMAVQQSSTSLGRTLLTELAPTLVRILDGLTNIAVWARGHGPFINTVFAGLTVVITGLGIAAAVALGSFLGLTAPILGIVAAFLALTVVGGLLFDDWETWMHGGQSEFGWFYDSVSTGLKDLVKDFTDSFKLIDDIVHGRWADVKVDWANVKKDAATTWSGTKHFAKKAISPDGSGYGGFAGAASPQEAAAYAEKKWGVPAAITLAQYQLESGNGKHMPAGSNNPFGIKAKGGEPYVEAMTTEVINGHAVRMMQRFRKFDSLAQAFDEHAKLLATAPAYKKARAAGNDANAYADALTGVYATDPNYGAKLKAIMAKNGKPGTLSAVHMAQQAHHAAAASHSNTAIHTTTTETKIDTMNVYSKADNAPGIAADIKAQVQRTNFASQANYSAT